MAEVTFRLKGLHVVLALLVLVAFAGLRFATLGEVEDAGLREAVRAELLSELGGRTSRELDRVDDRDAAALRRLAERADSTGIEIYSTRVSKPLLSLGSSERTVVLVEYSLPGGPRRSEYWLFEHSLAAGWRYRRETTALSYYLNFV